MQILNSYGIAAIAAQHTGTGFNQPNQWEIFGRNGWSILAG